MSSHQTEMKIIHTLLQEAMDEGLEVEVVYCALKAMREDETLSPSQAIQLGCEEWIK
jgi:hypothetical protein